MSNSFSQQTDLTTVLANIATVDTVVDTIRAVDVPNLAAQNTAIDAVVDAIRATDITTITTAISNKKIMGEFKRFDNANPGAVYENCVAVTGSGLLNYVSFITDVNGAGMGIITIDSMPCGEFTIGNSEICFIVPTYDVTWSVLFEKSTTRFILNFPYQNSLNIQYKSSAASFTAHIGYTEL